jgi:hypothetical protein
VGGNATFTATNANDDINLGTLAVTGSIGLNTNGANGDASLTSAGGAILGACNVGGMLLLNAAGAVTQTGVITTPQILLQGAGAYTLAGANDVNTLASNATGAINFNDADDITIGTVNGIAGIATGGANATISGGATTVQQAVNAGAGSVAITTVGANTLTLSNDITGATVSLTSGADINQAAGNLNATTLNLNSAQTIGAAGNYFDTLGGTVNATSTTGSIYMNNTGAVTLGAVHADAASQDVNVTSSGAMTVSASTLTAGRNVTLTTTSGSISLGVVSAGNYATLTAAGSILNTLGGTNVSAPGGAYLTAQAGVVGLKNAPINVNITGGALDVYANSQIDSVSMNISGTVPAGSTYIWHPANPPGLVMLNNNILYPKNLVDGNYLLTNTAGIYTATLLQPTNEDHLNPKSGLYQVLVEEEEEEEEEVPAPKSSSTSPPSGTSERSSSSTTEGSKEIGSTAPASEKKAEEKEKEKSSGAPSDGTPAGDVSFTITVVAQGGDSLRGAEVYVDGKRISPDRKGNYTVPVGNHELVVKKDGYYDYSTTITLKAGEPSAVKVVLAPKA